MKNHLTRLGALGALPLLLLAVGSTLREDALVFRPEPGASVEKTFEVWFHLAEDEIRVTIDGKEGPWSFEEVSFELTRTERIVVEDTWAALAGGHPTQLRRTFRELDGDWLAQRIPGSLAQGYGPSEELELASGLDGKTVLFTFDAEAGEYEVSYEDEGDPELLTGLVEDLDLRGFLPPGEVAAGETWSVPVAAWKELVSPGGNLHLESEALTSEHELLRQVHAAWTGDLEAEFVGRREVDGLELAVVIVTGKVESQAEVEIDSEGRIEEYERSLRVSMDVELEVLWNPARGHLHSLSMTGDVRAVHVLRATGDIGWWSASAAELVIETELSGKASVSATFER